MKTAEQKRKWREYVREYMRRPGKRQKANEMQRLRRAAYRALHPRPKNRGGRSGTRRQDPVDGSIRCAIHGTTVAAYDSPKEARTRLICRECRKEISRRWWSANRARHNLTMRLQHDRRRAAVILAYGSACECCGERTPDFLNMDHIAGDGKSHRAEIGYGANFYRWLIRNNFPRGNFRLLCYNCNMTRGRLGYCPHEALARLGDCL